MCGINKIQLLISSKIDENLLNSIVKKAFNSNSVKVVQVNVNSDTKKGDSYLSTICWIVVTLTDEKNSEKKLHIFAKGLPQNLAWRKTFRSVDFFENEVIFYNKVWPALLDFQKSKNVEAFTSIPLCHHAYADGINDLIALEDVFVRGYRGIIRSTGLDLEHVQIIMKMFAKFHGTSLAFKIQFPDKFEQVANSLKETYFCERLRPWYVKFQKINLTIIRDAVEKELPEIYLKKFDEIVSGDLYGNIIKLCAKRGKFAVITQGDAWVPNFLMKYDSKNKPLEGIMIDFQLARCSSLAQDLLFFLYSCTTQELRDKHWDFLINEYHLQITDTLKKLGTKDDCITLKDIQNELKENALFGIGMANEAVTMSILDDDETADTGALEGNEAIPLENVWILHPFKNPEKRQRLASFYKDAIDRGYF